MSKFKKGLELMKNYDIKKNDNGIKIIDNRTNLELADEPQNEQILAENKKLLTIVEYTVFEKHLSGLNQMLENEDCTFLMSNMINWKNAFCKHLEQEVLLFLMININVII